jgi:RimJ/RimL family protein N-acetyltransferase
MKPLPPVELKPYSESDLPILRRNNAPEMTQFLGGPETEEKLLDRHQRYVNLKPGEAYMYVIWLEGEPTGTIGYWEHESKAGIVWEAGWGILPEHQGRGIAIAALLTLIEKARAEGKHRYMHAYPRVDNLASNALCRNAGFKFIEESDFEYPKGNPIRCNDWQIDLQAE